MAVAYDVPIITVRKMGYVKDRVAFKRFQEEIIDRSRHDIMVSNKHLPVVTTLEKVLCTLYDQAIIYHKNISESFIEKVRALVATFPSSKYKNAKEKSRRRQINTMSCKDTSISTKIEIKQAIYSKIIYKKTSESNTESSHVYSETQGERKFDFIDTKKEDREKVESSIMKKLMKSMHMRSN